MLRIRIHADPNNFAESGYHHIICHQNVEESQTTMELEDSLEDSFFYLLLPGFSAWILKFNK